MVTRSSVSRTSSVEFKVGRGNTVKAVSGISFDVLRGETLGIVGESGCGKSTTGRAIMQIPPPTSGSIVFEGAELTEMSSSAVREARTLRADDLPRPCVFAQPAPFGP